MTAEPLRLGQHDHALLVYVDEEEMLDVVARAIRGAVAAGERHLHVLGRTPLGRFVEAMGARGLDVAELVRHGRLVLRDAQSTYLDGDGFDAERMLGLLAENDRDATTAWFTGTRATGEMSWIADAPRHEADAHAYESRLNEVLPQLSTRGICLYDASALPIEVIGSALRTHPKIVAEGKLRDNIAYGGHQPPSRGSLRVFE